MLRRAYFIFLCLALSGSFALLAQTSFGRLSGTIADATGAVIAGAKVTVRNSDTQDVRMVETDPNGFYIVTNLPIGPYVAEVNQPGFQKQQTGLRIAADSRLTADFKLVVGDVSQSVEVVAQAGEQLNVTSGELARVIESKQVSELSLNGNNYVELITLVPGAVVTNPDQFSVTTSLSATNQNINGNRADSQNLTVDGAFNLVAGSNGSLMNNVNPNFISEVKVQTSNMSAEYGRSAGVAFNVVTKNGTNKFHGAVFENFRNDKLDARSYFAATRNALRYNDFGYNLGGPIKKDKLFFFWGQDWKRLRQSQNPSRVTLPTTTLLSGNFGATNIFFPGTRDPIPGNVIPPSLITPDGQAIAAVYRLQEQRASVFTNLATANNTILQPSNPLDYRQHIIRLDYRYNDKHSVYGRWVSDRNALIDPYGTFSGSNLPTTPTQRNRPGESFLIAHTWLVSPTIVNEFRANASWASQNIPPYGDTWQRSTYGFKFPQLFANGGTGDYRNGIPDVSVVGYANFKGPSFALHSPSTDIQLLDSISWVKSPHVVKAGFAIIRDRVDQNGRPNYTGNLTFNATGNTRTSGNALADMLMGNFRTYSESSSDPMGFFRFWQPGAYIQDSWRVTRRLNFELGLRWELMQPMYTQANNMASFDPAKYDPARAVTITRTGTLVPGSGNYYNGLIRSGAGVPADELGRVPGSSGTLFQQIPGGAARGFYETQNAWSPRFGFAYAMPHSMVIRGGYGIFYARPQGNLIFSQMNLPPITQIAQLENGNLTNPGGGGGVIAPLANINSIDPNLKNGSAQQFSLSIQKEFSKKFFTEISYVGNLGRHLLRQPDINQVPFEVNSVNSQLPTAQQSATVAMRPYKGYNNIGMFLSDSTSNYHALQTYLSKRMGNLFFTAMYTWSKALGDASAQGDTSETYKNRHFNYGPQSFDRRHVFVGTYVWTLPRLKGWNPVARNVLGSWQLNGIIRLQTGQYYSISGNTSIGTRRADYLGGDLLVEKELRSNNAWINKTAFRTAPVDRLGNTGFGILTGPGLKSWNLALAKNFKFQEKYNLKVQTDFFNAFNIPNFTGLDTSVTNVAFGTLSSAYPTRQVQMQMRLTF